MNKYRGGRMVAALLVFVGLITSGCVTNPSKKMTFMNPNETASGRVVEVRPILKKSAPTQGDVYSPQAAGYGAQLTRGSAAGTVLTGIASALTINALESPPASDDFDYKYIEVKITAEDGQERLYGVTNKDSEPPPYGPGDLITLTKGPLGISATLVKKAGQ